ncbi:MAG: energy transducer TonB [Azovibrio sp.]
MTASDPAPGVDENALRQYRIALAQAAREFRRYPALARERGWEGVVRVRLQWPRGGGECVVEVLKGSGHSLLDEQAVLMLEQAARRSPLPESLRGQSFELILPVEFSLQQP